MRTDGEDPPVSVEGERLPEIIVYIVINYRVSHGYPIQGRFCIERENTDLVCICSIDIVRGTRQYKPVCVQCAPDTHLIVRLTAPYSGSHLFPHIVNDIVYIHTAFIQGVADPRDRYNIARIVQRQVLSRILVSGNPVYRVAHLRPHAFRKRVSINVNCAPAFVVRVIRYGDDISYAIQLDIVSHVVVACEGNRAYRNPLIVINVERIHVCLAVE